jgi:hypothetical protein
MATQLNSLLNPVQTPTGQSITTTVTNSVQSAATSAGAAISNSSNILVGEAGSLALGIASGVIGEAIAPVIEVGQKVSQVANLIQNPSLGGVLALAGRGFPPYRNELDQFTSYNSIFTLGCLTQIELNYPLSYRTMGPLLKIIKSGGTGGNKVPTIYETDGLVEFFIEDVEIKNHVAPNPGTRHSNAMSIKFKVIEPYSMGQFFHNLRTAAMIAGHNNYIEAPFLLSVAFVGYDDDGNVKSPLFSQRHIPIRFIKAEMNVSGGGAVYDIIAAPYNEMALTDTVQEVKTDVKLKGSTVHELLQSGAESLTTQINNVQAELERTKQVGVGDYYIISFPNGGLLESAIGSVGATALGAISSLTGDTARKLYESITGDKGGDYDMAALQAKLDSTSVGMSTSALAAQLNSAAENEATMNNIGKSKMFADFAMACTPTNPMGEASFVEDPNNPGTFIRGNVIATNNFTEYTFKNGTSVSSIIEEVVLTSEWAKQQAEAAPDANGRRTWFRIETQVFNGSSLFGGLFTGQSPKIYVYRVVPYTVDAANTSPPQTSFTFANLFKQNNAIKAYNYIYTGDNTDIIDFDLQFNLAFFTGVQAARNQRSSASTTGAQNSVVKGNQEAATVTGESSSTVATASGSAPIQNVSSRPNPSGGGNVNSNDSRTGNVRDINHMIINSSNDMIGVDLTIHGDPYYLVDAGIGNYIGISNPLNQAITVEGSMNPIKGEVHVALNFRTPIDYDADDGFVKYPLGGFLPITMFSGIYQVIIVDNMFSKGKFTQKLKLVRKRNQDLSPESAVLNAVLSGANRAQTAIRLGIESNRMNPPVEGGTA